MILPDSALAQHIAITGRTGAGKTFAAKGFVERLLDQRRRVCIIDPTDGWFGLRSSADGKRPGYPVVVFGGDHGDVPINAHSGAALAEFVAGQTVPCIISTAEMRIDERRQFMSEFLDGLFRHNKAPLHLIVDEADEIAPQNPMPDTKVVLHRFDRIVRRGRIRGFRVMMITQRPAVLHKNCLTQAATLIAMRLMSPQDRKAIEAWIEGQADIKKGKAIIDSLPSLKRGEGWVWSPDHDILQRVAFPKIKTFDSSRAPEEGEAWEPSAVAKTDLTAIRERFSEAEKEAAANDPKLLRRRIAELERDATRKDFKVLSDPQEIERARAEAHEEGRLSGYADGVAEGWGRCRAAFAEHVRALSAAIAVTESPPHVAAPKRNLPARPAPTPKPTRIIPQIIPAGPGEQMPGPQRKLLTVLAQYPQGRTKKQLAVLAGYAHNGGAFANPLSNLRARGWAEGGADCIAITEAGLVALGSWEPLPTGRKLQEYWLANLPGPAAKLLRALCEVYPRGMEKVELARACDYEPNGGAFANALSRLRSLELASGYRGAAIVASEDLFG